jgi:type I restriction enzyme M protein
MLGDIFDKSQNKIQDPEKLLKLIYLIDKENWIIDNDVKGEIYEGLLEKNAEDTKSGAGQYFTPRALIKTIVEVVQPKPKKSIADPACGTGGFLLSAYEYLSQQNLTKSEEKFLKESTFFGNEIVANTRRLALMNMFLHNLGKIDGESMIIEKDALIEKPKKVDYVFANPPFGVKSAMSIGIKNKNSKKEELNYVRDDFWTTTSNKQLNFIQHIYTMLKPKGEASIVIPDNVLFERGAGEIIRKNLLEKTNLHTILRLPTGIFYANGVKANVLFFENKPKRKKAWTEEIWIYDYRTNIHVTKKKNPLKFEDLQNFINCYCSEDRSKRVETYSNENPEGRWRKYSYTEILVRDSTNLDISWTKNGSLKDLENLPEPEELASEIIEDIELALAGLKEVLLELEDEG